MNTEDREIPNNPNEIQYSETEYQQWKEGAVRYSQFIEKCSATKELSDVEKGQIKALFLKEKPAIFALSHLKIIGFDFMDSGFKIAGDYVYDQEGVQRVIDTHSEIFSTYGVTADEVMDKLSKENRSLATIMRGLVLGFPLSAVQRYERVSSYPVRKCIKRLYDSYSSESEKRKIIEQSFYDIPDRATEEIVDFLRQEFELRGEELGIKPAEIGELLQQAEDILNTKGVSVHGNYWVDAVSSSESDDRKRRLDTAFQSSGVLEM